MNSPFAVEVESLSFSYPGREPALLEVSFTVAKGTFTAFLAPNGAGKTTLFKTLAGALSPSRGSVHLLGAEVRALSTRERCQRVGLVFQNPTDQLFAATVEEDVAFGPRNLALPIHEVNRRIEEALRAVDALHLSGRPIQHLSYGEQKRVALAGVLAMAPEILLVDEPAAGLDPQGEIQIMELLRQLNRGGQMTIIIATHAVDLLPLVADHLFIMHGGRILSSGSPRAIFAQPELLKQARLRAPYLAQLTHTLRWTDGLPLEGDPLTLEETRRSIRTAMELLRGSLHEERGQA